jgi:hypothetical protein
MPLTLLCLSSNFEDLQPLQEFCFYTNHDMFMRFRGGGVGHKSTLAATSVFEQQNNIKPGKRDRIFDETVDLPTYAEGDLEESNTGSDGTEEEEGDKDGHKSGSKYT